MTNQDKSNAETLSEKQLSAIPLVIGSKSMTEAAEKIGISRNTLYEWMKIPAFKAEQQRQTDLVVEWALERLKLNVVKAVDVLGAMLDSPNTNVFYKREVSLDVLKIVLKNREQSKIAQLEGKVSDLEIKLSDRTGVQSKVK